MPEFLWKWTGRIADLWSLAEPVRKLLGGILLFGGSFVTWFFSWLGIPLWQAAIVGLTTVLGLLATAYVGVRIGRELSPSSQLNYFPLGKRELTDRRRDSSLSVSPQDAANREKIIVLSRAHAHPTYVASQQVADKILEQLCNSENRKLQTIGILIRNFVFVPCNQADVELSRTLANSDKNSIGLLQQRLWEFFDAYQELVYWMNHLANYLYVSSYGGEPRFATWKEQHKLFHQELRKLIASDDFSQLRERLHGQWDDIQG